MCGIIFGMSKIPKISFEGIYSNSLCTKKEKKINSIKAPLFSRLKNIVQISQVKEETVLNKLKLVIKKISSFGEIAL